MKQFAYISVLIFILVFSAGCEKYEVVGPDEQQEDVTLRHEDLINDHIFELDRASSNQNDLRSNPDRPDDDGGDGITDDDDEDDDSSESQDKAIAN